MSSKQPATSNEWRAISNKQWAIVYRFLYALINVNNCMQLNKQFIKKFFYKQYANESAEFLLINNLILLIVSKECNSSNKIVMHATQWSGVPEIYKKENFNLNKSVSSMN